MIGVRIAYDENQDTERDYYPKKDFSWNITNYDRQSMEFEIDFTYPEQVSQQGGQDKVEITFEDTRLMYDFMGRDLTNGTLLSRQIPPQYQSETEAEVFGAISETFTTIETEDFSANFILNALIAGVLQQIWCFVISQ